MTGAVEAGTRVCPHAWHDKTASVFAVERSAAIAVGRRAATSDSPWPLSPAALREAPFATRPVLPSPNGSAIAAVTTPGSTVVAGCLRNASAVGRWLAVRGYGTSRLPVPVIAAGERWPDGSLRPAPEDLLGAGASGRDGRSPAGTGGRARCRPRRPPRKPAPPTARTFPRPWPAVLPASSWLRADSPKTWTSPASWVPVRSSPSLAAGAFEAQRAD
ncbi:hypothetical protein AB0N09_43280 [Streptomyces erythrochromogenes]|uniref:hypothetical protein n=1 Tax=Streptomyces erythrochromogenes TaxID=285574 RepID=UPI00341A8B72